MLPPRNRNRGFTLVEVVVSLTIVTLIAAATLTAIRTLGDTQERLQAVTERLDRMRLVSRFLQTSLRQAVPLTPDPEAQGGRTAVLGDENELTWTGPLHGPGNAAGLYHMRLYVDSSATLGIQFLPRRGDTDPEPLDWSGAQTEVLAKNTESLEVAYRDENDGEWRSNWGEEIKGMPEALRLRIRVGDRYWPDLVVTPDQYGMNND